MGSPLRHLPLLERFWAQVDRLGHDDCGPWTGTRTQSGNGYGQIEEKGVRYQAHRFSYALAFGPIPEGKVACHRCDNPVCVNPGHIFIGTQADNLRDMVRKGRHRGRMGERKSHCKRGHAFEGENIRIASNGQRQCRACDRLRDAKSRAVKR